MSADQITDARVAELRERVTTGGPTRAWRRSDYLAVLDALTASRAEVKAIRRDTEDAAGELLIEIPEPGSVASKMLMANTMMRRERDKARSEVQRLTEEARRSDAGRVEGVERRELTLLRQHWQLWEEECCAEDPAVFHDKVNAREEVDALLRELLGGWSPSELVEAKIPGVLQMADEIATLRRERDEAREQLRHDRAGWKNPTPTPGAQV